jgi:hypothetical protein
MKPWQLGDGDNTVETEQLRMEFIYDRINNSLLAAGIDDPTTFAAFASYLGYSGGSGQDMQVAWTPTSVKLGEGLGFFAYGPIPGWVTGVFDQSTSINGFDIEMQDDLVSLSFPNLVSIDPLNTAGGYFTVNGCPLLTTLSLPLFVQDSGAFGFLIHLCPSLSNLSLPSWVPHNGQTVRFNDNGLSASSVNGILSRCVSNAAYVSGTVYLDGGTNAAPTGQGLLDVITLTGRGVTVNTN